MPTPKYPGYGVKTNLQGLLENMKRTEQAGGYYPIGFSNCPVVTEFLRQARTDQPGLDITALWNVQGRPPEMKPGRWARERFEVGRRRPLLRDDFDGPIMAVGMSAVSYALELDERLENAYHEHHRRRYPTSPAQALLEVPTPLVAMFAICDVMTIVVDGISPRDAARHLMAAVVTSVEGLDPWRAEAVVAVAQRALAGDKPPTGHWLN